MGCPNCQSRLIHDPAAERTSRAAELTEARVPYSGVAAGHVQRIVSQFERRRQPTGRPPGADGTADTDDQIEHAAWLDRELGRADPASVLERGVTIAPWARIDGEVSGQRTRICPACARDYACGAGTESWHHLKSGLFVCHQCAAGCTNDHCMGYSGAAHTSAGWASGQELLSHDVEECDSSGYGRSSPPGDPIFADPPHPESEGAECINCGVPIGQVGTSWRICTCQGTLCESCWCVHGACPSCRGDQGWLYNGGGQDHGEWLQAETESLIEDDADNDLDSDVEPISRAFSGKHKGPQQPQTLTPAQADALRDQLDADRRAEMRETRTRSRAIAASQVKQGTRPRRQQRRRRVDFLTLNVNCARRLRDEVTSGDLFKGVHGAFVQEHREHGDGKDRLISWLRHRGWDPVAEDAYLKVSDYGGGPLIMTRDMGLRPLAGPPETHAGRVCWGETDINGSVLCGSIYAISGQGAGKQVPLLKHVVQRVVTMGLPCVLAGDWQLPPRELLKTGIMRLLDAEIISTGLPTNVVSGGELDYFIVSRSLLAGGAVASLDPSGAFSPHMAVRLSLTIDGGGGERVRRLRVPRLLPIERITGPLPVPQYTVDWSEWHNNDDTPNPGTTSPPQPLSKLTDEWYAGAEVELFAAHGVDLHDAGVYRGMGRAGTMIQAEARGRFRSAADDVGLLGQRLAWASKALWSVIVAMGAPLDSQHRRRYLELASTMAPRAMAFRRELNARPNNYAGSIDHLRILMDALRLVGRAGLRVRGVPALLHRLRVADYPDKLNEFRNQYNTVGAVLLEVCEHRHRKSLRTVRIWARCASEKLAHRATKRPEVAPLKSASADKHHAGELTDQRAADHGMAEWSNSWEAEIHDGGGDILKTVEETYRACDESDLLVISSPPYGRRAAPRAASISERLRRGS